jgi:hypothetical protein
MLASPIEHSPFERFLMHLEPLDDQSLLMVHMGVGNARQATKTVFANHDVWIPLVGRGRFTVSVYAAPSDNERTAILSAMPQSQYGEATVATIRESGIMIVATNTVDGPEATQDIQRLHYSLIVQEGFEAPVADRDEQDRAQVIKGLVEPVSAVLGLFAPRVTNPLRQTTL